MAAFEYSTLFTGLETTVFAALAIILPVVCDIFVVIWIFKSGTKILKGVAK